MRFEISKFHFLQLKKYAHQYTFQCSAVYANLHRIQGPSSKGALDDNEKKSSL